MKVSEYEGSQKPRAVSPGVPVDTPFLFLYNLLTLLIRVLEGILVFMEISEIRRVRLDKLKSLEEHSIAPYCTRFDRTHSISEVLANFEEEKEVSFFDKRI
ncbi:hypothetical protein IH781_00820 [Patescibacteria group bacterium]|nr:hypothetical protein [Patescibacteria group bacterium]